MDVRLHRLELRHPLRRPLVRARRNTRRLRRGRLGRPPHALAQFGHFSVHLAGTAPRRHRGRGGTRHPHRPSHPRIACHAAVLRTLVRDPLRCVPLHARRRRLPRQGGVEGAGRGRRGAALAGGRTALRWSWPALAFLLFMVPLPFRLEKALAHPLQRVATLASTYALQA
ncbi:MAG: archaeosortase/exosortase family protein, partial [Thermoplasmatota archaeon]